MPTKKSSNFSIAVKAIVSKIKPGTVMTYKEVARQAGNPKAARAVALVMSANFDEAVPCHRVIRSDGSLGGYNRGGTKAKLERLLGEGWNQHPD